jgi:DNA/RNA endonuclease YhcR with UshA esterase domain
MRIPQIVMASGLLVLVVLLLSPSRQLPRYDPAAEVTLHGVVTDVREFYCPLSAGEGTHINVATENGTVEVHVAPTGFLLGTKWQFFRGDQVEVTGSPLIYHGHAALIARSVARGPQVVALRKADGTPLWLE